MQTAVAALLAEEEANTGQDITSIEAVRIDLKGPHIKPATPDLYSPTR